MAQFFMENKFQSSFEDGILPTLLYVCEADSTFTKLPRILHKHDDIMEIVFIREGSGSHFIGDKQYNTRKGDLLIYNSSVLHDEHANPDTTMSVYCCGVTNLKLKDLAENHLVSEGSSYVLHSGEYATEIESLFRLLCMQVKEQRPGAEELGTYLLCSLIALILQLPQEAPDRQNSEEWILANRIKGYMDDHYLEDISLESMARTLTISPYYLAHVFKEATGFSPIQYIIRRRIGQAQSLLINTNHSVTQIAGMVNYDNISYFTTLFSRIVGMSPKKYRQLWRNPPKDRLFFK
jgi:AraC-like DNA-binding protein